MGSCNVVEASCGAVRELQNAEHRRWEEPGRKRRRWAQIAAFSRVMVRTVCVRGSVQGVEARVGTDSPGSRVEVRVGTDSPGSGGGGQGQGVH